MAGIDGFLFLFLLTFLGLFHYLAYILHRRKNVPYWGSAIGLALLVPLVVFALYMPIEIERNDRKRF